MKITAGERDLTPDAWAILATSMPEQWPDRQLVKGGARRYPRDEVHASRGKEAPDMSPPSEHGRKPAFHVDDGRSALRGRRDDWSALAARSAPGVLRRRRALDQRRAQLRRRAAVPGRGRDASCRHGRFTSCSSSRSCRSPGRPTTPVTRTASTRSSTSGSASSRSSSSRDRVAIAYLVAIGAAYAWLLLELDTSAGAARWITTIGTVALGAFLIDSLVEPRAPDRRRLGRAGRGAGRPDGDARRGRPHRRSHRALEPPRLGRGARA